MIDVSGMGTVDPVKWGKLLRVVEREFPDVFGECDDNDSDLRGAEIRALIIAAAMAGEGVVWLRDRLGDDPATIMGLKRCAAAAREVRGLDA